MKIKRHVSIYLLVIVIVCFTSRAFATDLVLDTPLAGGDYISDEDIIADNGCEIVTGTNVTFVANDDVLFEPGFAVQDGAGLSVHVGYIYDFDSDTIPDFWERKYFNDSLTVIDDWGNDYDNDSLTNLQEYNLGTNPNNKDSEGDGMWDGWEYVNGLNPLGDDADGNLDTDNFTNYIEFKCGTEPDDPNDEPDAGHYYEYDEDGRIKHVIRIQ